MRLPPLVLLLSLAACGSRGELMPAAGKSLPPAPRGAAAPLTAPQLLAQPAEAAPERADDPVKNARPRVDDRFELPPPG